MHKEKRPLTSPVTNSKQLCLHSIFHSYSLLPNMQFQAVLLSVLVTLAAAAPVAEPQGLRNPPGGGSRLSRAADPQVRFGDCGLAIREADPQIRFGDGCDLAARDADPQYRGPGGHNGGSVVPVAERAVLLEATRRAAEPQRGNPGGGPGAAIADRAAVPYGVVESRGRIQGPAGGGR